MVALNGLWMQRVTIGWIAWELTSSASFVGFVAFVNYAPTMVTGPFFGVLIDRVRIKHAALVTQFLLLMLALIFYGSFTLELLNPFVLSVISGVLGIVTSAHNPVRMSLAPRLVKREAIVSVVTLVAINFHMARMTGPALGGWIIATWGVGASLFVQAMCYLPFILAISFLRPRERCSAMAVPEPFLAALRSGIDHAFRTTLIRRAILITGVFAFIARGTLEILPVLADGIFDKGPSGLGLLTSSAGLGALVAGLMKAVMPGQGTGRLPRTALAMAVIGVALVSFIGASGVWEFSLVLIACLGFTASMSAISMQTAIQVDLEDDLRGRVMSLWVMVGIGAAAAGAIILGFIVDQIGFSQTLGWSGALGFVFLGLFVVRVW